MREDRFKNDISERVVEILSRERLRGRERRCLIDATGVGQPVVDMIRQACRDREETRTVFIKPITFASGETYNEESGRLGKALLVSRLQALLQEGRIQAPDTKEVRAMLEELRVYEIKLDTNGRDTYGAMVGKHDDMATALGLAFLEERCTADDHLADLKARIAIQDKRRGGGLF